MQQLAVVTRNRYVESLHHGFICVVDSDGKVVYEKGDINTKFFFRSAAKPIQIIPFIHSGGAKAMDYSSKEIAIGCASHTGEKIHQDTVLKVLKRLDFDVNDLHCGVKRPYNEEENNWLIYRGEKPSPLHAGCSGKHAAMLAYSKYLGYDISDYHNTTHPVQQEVLKTISFFTEQEADNIPIGVDGCGLPIFILPIYNMALSYARLARYSQDTDNAYYEACRTVFEAMNKHPEMVAGTGEFCTELMQCTGGKLIAKIGAEAVYCLGIKDKNLGACIKIVDGGERAVYPVVVQLLMELGAITDIEYKKLKHWHQPKILNNLDEHIGYIIPVFQNNEDLLLGSRVN
ncbi:MAG: asparaginase [Acetivibrionales bacterium]|jgi:L-asparaginase II